jgi:hypothetical protein
VQFYTYQCIYTIQTTIVAHKNNIFVNVFKEYMNYMHDFAHCLSIVRYYNKVSHNKVWSIRGAEVQIHIRIA